MKSLEEIANEVEITEDLDIQYDRIIEALQEAKANQTPLDEGILGALCDALGINPKGALGSLMTSRLIMTAVAGKIGARI